MFSLNSEFHLQADLGSVRISLDVGMDGTSSECWVSSAAGKDESVSSHQEDW